MAANPTTHTTIPHITDLRGVPVNIQRELEMLRTQSYQLLQRLNTIETTATSRGLTKQDITTIQQSIQITGTHPVNVTNLIGILAQPQRAYVPSVTGSLPAYGDILSQDGQIIYKADENALYRFNGAITPGVWVLIAGTKQIAVTLTADRVEAVPTGPPNGSEVEYQYTQDGVGGHKVTWNVAFKGVDGLTVGRLANRLSVVRFRFLSSTQIVRLFSMGDISLS